MDIDQRDLDLLRRVAEFKQMSSKQIGELIFFGNSSTTPMYRALRRLVDRGYLASLEHKIVGGANAGSGVYVYQLDSKAWEMFYEGRARLATAVNYHSLGIVDCYLALVKLERQGKLAISGYLTEPACHVTIGSYVLKPDLFAEIEHKSQVLRFMFEIDMGTQTSQIVDKLDRYWKAYDVADESVWPQNQVVPFVTLNERRAEELRWTLGRWRKDWADLFWVHTVRSLETVLS